MASIMSLRVLFFTIVVAHVVCLNLEFCSLGGVKSVSATGVKPVSATGVKPKKESFDDDASNKSEDENSEDENSEGEMEFNENSEDENKDGKDMVKGVVPLDADVGCDKVKPFPIEVFDKQPLHDVVYTKYAMLPANSLFSSLEFNRYITIFGIHFIATKETTDAGLYHSASIFAGFLDNDNDGVIDNSEVVNSVRDYRLIVGFMSDAEESNILWKKRIKLPESAEFARQYKCNFHFFEQWESDATPNFFKKEINAAGTVDEYESCAALKEVDFDWSLWYSLFTITYYGYMEVFDKNTIDALRNSMEKARTEGFYKEIYRNDPELEIADYFVWTLLTKLDALRCHCNRPVIDDVWKLCTKEELKKFDPKLFALLVRMDGVPTRLPNARYLEDHTFPDDSEIPAGK